MDAQQKIAQSAKAGRAHLHAFEAHYKNGEARDNLTDMLADLMHAGIDWRSLFQALETARQHVAYERVHGDE